MKAQILKIAGVKSEKEFYSKYPTQEAFMKVHGKEFKKAQIGALVSGEAASQSSSKPFAPINFQDIYDKNDKLITGSTQAERDKAAADAAKAAAANQGGASGGGMDLGGIMKMFGGEGGGAEGMGDMAAMAARYGTNIPIAQGGILQGPENKPSKDYFQNNNPFFATKPGPTGLNNPAIATPQPGTMDKIGAAISKYAGPAGQVIEGIQDLKAEKAARKDAQRDATVSGIARMASATREEESERKYVRPEDIQNTGEEFFPIYGVGTNVLSRNGGQFHRAQNGDYIGGNPTEIQNTYSDGYDIYTDGGYEPLQDPNQLKDFRHGGYLHRAENGFWSGGADASTYGQIGSLGAGVGQAATGGKNAGGKIGGAIGKTAGQAIGGPVGGMIGEAIVGTVGNLLDTNGRDMAKAQNISKSNTTAMSLNSGFQGLQESNNRYVRNGGDIPSYEDGGYMNPEYNPQVITMFGDHDSEDFADYANKFRAGGHLKEYTPPSERAMETFAMGGQLQTHWGGEAERVSHNRYMPGSGETVVFRGQSHNESDGKGNTGIGITYGDNPVEVERGEPMFEMQSGGEVNPETGEPENTGVVFGNMQVDKRVASQFNDPDLMKVADIYNGKKFKNIGIDLAKQEVKQNKIIDKNSKLIDSLKVETSLDKVRLAGLQAMLEGADTKLRDIANTKITLANYQNAINDAKEELSEVIGENLSAEDLAKGYTKLDKDPVTKNAKNGANLISKAQTGTKIFKSEREANAAGYTKGDDGKYRRTIKKFSTKDTETKSADALDEIPKGQKQSDSGLWGKVTTDELASTKAANSWYPGWKTFDPKKKADVIAYQKAFNKRAKEVGSTKKVTIDGDFGEQTVSTRIDEARKTTPATTEEELMATVDEPMSPAAEEEKAKFPWMAYANQALRYLTPSDQQGLDNQQLYPEFYAMASNQVEPVPAQSYQPDLIVPYDISLQAQRNSVMSSQRALERQLGYNPAAQANATPAAYNAINEINEKEFMANQGMKSQVYNANTATMNDAKKINLGIFADQWAKQSQARSNTKATTQAALNSIADKYAKNKLENRKLSIYENMYNYRFGNSGKAKNYNGLQFFDTQVGGTKSGKGQSIPEGYKATSYDVNGNPTRLQPLTDKDVEEDVDGLEAIGKNKNGGSTKKNYKNGSVVRAFKNL